MTVWKYLKNEMSYIYMQYVWNFVLIFCVVVLCFSRETGEWETVFALQCGGILGGKERF